MTAQLQRRIASPGEVPADGGWHRSLRYVALAVVTATLLLDVVGLVLHIVTWETFGPLFGDRYLLLNLLETPEPLVALFAVAGAFIAFRRPRNVVAWLLIAIGFSSGLFVFLRGYAVYAQLVADLAGGAISCWTMTWTWYPAFALIPLLVLLFPDGRLPSRRWRPAAWVAIAAVGAGLVGFPFVPDTGVASELVACADPSFPAAGPLVGLGMALLLVSGVLALAASFWRARQPHPVQRAQIKWFALAVGLVLAAVWARDFSTPGTTLHRILVVAVAVVVPMVPAAIAVAILRYRLYDIDRLVSRTVSYGLVTAVLAAVYAGVVFVLGRLLPVEGEPAIAGATLAVAALFNPVRRRVQEGVDRRFNRSRYDAEHAVDAFSERLRSAVELPELQDDLAEVVGDTVEPTHISLWLRRESPPD